MSSMNLHTKDLRELVVYFIRDEAICNPIKLVTGADLYRRFAFWCRSKEIQPVPKSQFYRNMQSQGWRVHSLSVGRIVQGLRLREH
jgi:hypothetical protein